MKLFFDSSALLKRYVSETGSDAVDKLFNTSSSIFVSSITQLECTSAFQRLLHSGHIDKKTSQQLVKDVSIDFSFYQIIEYDQLVKDISLQVVEKHLVKPLDCIQLSSLLSILQEIDHFVVCDQQLKKFAVQEGVNVLDPTHIV